MRCCGDGAAVNVRLAAISSTSTSMGPVVTIGAPGVLAPLAHSLAALGRPDMAPAAATLAAAGVADVLTVSVQPCLTHRWERPIPPTSPSGMQQYSFRCNVMQRFKSWRPGWHVACCLSMRGPCELRHPPPSAPLVADRDDRSRDCCWVVGLPCPGRTLRGPRLRRGGLRVRRRSRQRVQVRVLLTRRGSAPPEPGGELRMQPRGCPGRGSRGVARCSSVARAGAAGPGRRAPPDVSPFRPCLRSDTGLPRSHSQSPRVARYA
jgi:hypothetical protein